MGILKGKARSSEERESEVTDRWRKSGFSTEDFQEVLALSSCTWGELKKDQGFEPWSLSQSTGNGEQGGAQDTFSLLFPHPMKFANIMGRTLLGTGLTQR